MTYNPYEWTNGELITDVKLNHIEDGIGSNSEDIEALRGAYGTPLVASSVADMTDTNKIYVYVGNESGYTNGHWYYYNGTAWADGGAYNATALVTDTTLSIAGEAADAKATGDAVNDLKSALASALPTASASGAIASFDDGAEDVPVKNLTVGIEPVQSGSGDPSPDNVRPISGWTAVNVTRAGKNLIRLNDTEQRTAAGIVYQIQNGKIVFFASTSTGNGDVDTRLASTVLLKAGQAYTFSISGVTVTGNKRLFIGVGNEYPAFYNFSGQSVTFTPTSDLAMNGILLRLLLGATVTSGTAIVQLELGDTATAYEPYTAQTYPISFGSAGTVYGGTLDVTTGVLTVDTISELTLTGQETIITSGATGNFFSAHIKNDAMPASTNNEKGWCISNELVTVPASLNHLGALSNVAINTSGRLIVNVYGATSLSEWRAYFANATTPIKIYYQKNTQAQTYQLTPTEVRTLLGSNNIYSDTGDSTVEYKADTGKYIENRINAQQKLISGVETSYTATKNYAIGNYVIVNDTLYKVTAAIASGATIAPGTNCVATTVAEQLILLAQA